MNRAPTAAAAAATLLAILACSGATGPQPEWEINTWKTDGSVTSKDGKLLLEVGCGGSTPYASVRLVDTGPYPFAGRLTAKSGSATLHGEADNYEGRSHLEGLAALIQAGGDRLELRGETPEGKPRKARFVIAGAEAMVDQLACN